MARPGAPVGSRRLGTGARGQTRGSSWSSRSLRADPRHAGCDRRSADPPISEPCSSRSRSTRSRSTCSPSTGIQRVAPSTRPCTMLDASCASGWRRTGSHSTRQALGHPGPHKEGKTMLDFTLTDEQRNIRDMAHDFAENEIRPVAWDYDRDATWPKEIIDKAWEVGLMNSQLPERYGGAGASYVDGVLIGEELAWGCAAIAHHARGQRTRGRAGRCSAARSRSRRSTSACSPRSPSSPSFCLTEPDAGSDVSAMRTTAVRTRRQVRDQRLQDVHHQRRLRRLVHGLRQDRQGRRPPRHLGLRCSRVTTRSRSTSTRTRWACAPRTRPRSASTRQRCRRRTCSARRTTASSWR